METLNAQPENTVAGSQPSRRSASYPGLTVLEAFEFTKKIYEKFSNSEVTRKEAATGLGLHPQTIARDVAAAASFGLLEKVNVKGEADVKYKISELFSDIYRPENEKQKKISLITAFGKPKLYQELINKFDGELIAETFPNTLIKHHNITINASAECADVFIRSGIEVGVIGDNRVLNYKVTLGATSKSNVIEDITPISVTENAVQHVASTPTILEPKIDNEIREPIYLTKGKIAFLAYPSDISEKDIKLLQHTIAGILLKLELEKDGEVQN